MKMSKLTTLTLAMAGLASCATSNTISSLDPKIQSQLTGFNKKVERYESRGARLLSPGHFETVESLYKDVKEDAYSGMDFSGVSSKLSMADKYFNKMDESLEIANLHLNDVMDARSEALDEKAGSTELFKEADEELKELGYEVEEKDINDVLEERSDVEKMYVNAEIMAIKKSELTKAKSTFAKALEKDGSDHFDKEADITEQDIISAERLIEKFKDSPERYKAAVVKAEVSAERLMALSETATWIDEKDTRELVFKLDKDLNDLLIPLAYSGSKLKPYKEKMEIAKIETESIPVLMNELTAAQIDSYMQEKNLRYLKAKNKMISAKLDEREKAKAKVDKIRSMFSNNEAKIFINDDDLIIRLVGLNFAFDDATLPDNSKRILRKVAKTAKTLDFPEMKIVGHADSKGDALYNERLSQKRAVNVNKFLVKNTDIKDENINVEGAGFTNPVTENKTDTGRKMNRRIDVVFNSVVR